MSNIDAWRHALWMAYKDNHEYVRHHESQRSTVAALIVTVSAGALAGALFDGVLSAIDIPPLVLVVLIGIFGHFFSRRQFERTRMHIERADALMGELAHSLGGWSVVDITNASDRRYEEAYRRRHPRKWTPPVHHLWTTFYWTVSGLGAILLGVVLLDMFWDINPGADRRPTPPMENSSVLNPPQLAYSAPRRAAFLTLE